MKRLLFLLLLMASPVMAQRIVIITGGTVTANVTDSADFYVTLNQNVTGVTLTSTVTPATGYLVSMKFVQDATGSRTVVFGGNISTSCAVNSTANSVTICRWQYTASSNAWADAAGGAAATPGAIPGTAGLNAVPVTSGLLAEYRILATESACALVDYSGNGNDATGCVGTNPTIVANTGGLSCTLNGAVGIPASLNTAKTIQIYMTGAPGTFGSPIAGNGANANSVGLMLALAPQSGDSLLGMDRLFSAKMNGTYGAYPRAAVPGNVVITWTMDTTDHLFFNNLEPLYYTTPIALAGIQTVGNFQICGNSGNHYGQNPSYLQGKVYYVVLYSRVLTASEIAANVQYINSAMAARGVTPSIFNTAITTTPVLVADGDSITEGIGFGVTTPYPALLTLNQLATGNINNMGVQALTLTNLLNGAGVSVDPLYQSAPSTTDIIWAGTNDISGGSTGAQAEARLAAYCKARRVIGWKCIAVTMVSRTGFDSGKNTFNSLVRQHWNEWADGLADVAADVSLGADGASANTIFIQAGGVHPTQNSVYNDEVPIIQRAINRLYGNNDFSTATTYVAPAAAAVATTALSESGNTVTVTFGATPANCQVGNSIVIAGVTSTGYNSTAANGAGNGAWTILSSTGTQVTYYDATTGLGAASIQGTGVCPQQQDADTFSILNFGAGNFTLQSCVGYTGQNIYIQNINAVASTLVPFGSETITGGGATPTTLTNATTAILQSELVSAAAGGCNWRRLQ